MSTKMSNRRQTTKFHAHEIKLYFTVVAQVNGWTLYFGAIYIGGGAHGFGDAAVILSYM